MFSVGEIGGERERFLRENLERYISFLLLACIKVAKTEERMVGHTVFLFLLVHEGIVEKDDLFFIFQVRPIVDTFNLHICSQTPMHARAQQK